MSAVQQIIWSYGSRAGGPPTDPDINMLMSFDGDYTEANGLTVTENGTLSINSTDKKFGSGSLNASEPSSYLSVAAIGSRASGDSITVECWFNMSEAFPGGEYELVKAHGNASISIFCEASPNYQYVLFRYGSGFVGFPSSRDLIPFNAWNHLRGVYDGTTAYVFLNGTLIESAARTATAGANTVAEVGISSSNDPGGTRTLYIDEAAIFVTAESTATFTPPTSAYPRS